MPLGAGESILKVRMKKDMGHLQSFFSIQPHDPTPSLLPSISELWTSPGTCTWEVPLVFSPHP